MGERKSSDTPFYVDIHNSEHVIDNKIKKHNILGLKDMDNYVTFMIALALGVDKGRRVPLQKRKSWVRPSSFKQEYLNYIDAVALKELIGEGKENLITSTDAVYTIIEEYVNSGLLVIDEMVPDSNSVDIENISYELLSKICDVYDEISDNT